MLSKETLNFNKEIVFGEFGSLIGIQSTSFLSIVFHIPIKLIPYLVVLSTMVLGSSFWALTRIHDQSKKEKYTFRNLLNDVKYFAPASTIISLALYQPTLFFLTKYLLSRQIPIAISSIFSEFCAFSFFLISMNTYRFLLSQLTKKRL